ncbi:hypothetical protein ACFQ9H_19285 [Streptomyces sp. NPDC056517]|uniref:hypothetical protein n=1 Tax=Streptomyces sp. NPDC056517 TaxID=3345848 RepID=UPI0036CB7FFD
MVTLDVFALVENNTHELLDLLMGEFFEQFVDLANATTSGGHDGHAPETLGFEQLLAALVERLSKRQCLTGTEAVRAAREMLRIAEPMVAAAERDRATLLRLATSPVREAS